MIYQIEKIKELEVTREDRHFLTFFSIKILKSIKMFIWKLTILSFFYFHLHQ